METRVGMDVIAALAGSDKGSTIRFSWDYLRHYETLFAPFRDAPVTLLEIGVQAGPSLKIWEWYFSQAGIVGVDINPACRALAGGRVSIEIGNQADPEFITRLCRDYAPSILIDDGSHRAAHMIATFETAFPLLPPGAIYVVEDFGLHFGPDAAAWQTEEKRDVTAYFQAIGRHLLSRGASPDPAGPAPELLRQIDTATLFGSAIALTKVRGTRDAAAALAVARDWMAANGAGAERQERLADYLLRHGGDAAAAEAALDAALAEAGPSLRRLLLRSEARLALGKRELAAEDAAAAAGTVAEERDLFTLVRLGQVQIALADKAGAAATAERLDALAGARAAAGRAAAALRRRMERIA